MSPLWAACCLISLITWEVLLGGAFLRDAPEEQRCLRCDTDMCGDIGVLVY